MVLVVYLVYQGEISVVIAGIIMLWLALAGYLLMLGLIAEIALWAHRRGRDAGREARAVQQ